jgi:two-component system OmpR family response regulator
MRAFVVDDDPDLRELACGALERAGWTVDAAEDGLAALGTIRHVIPQVIVLDLRMPNLSGVEVLKLLRSTEVGRQIPVVVTTGAVIEDSVRALATAILVKPFSLDDLLRVVAEVTQPGVSKPA